MQIDALYGHWRGALEAVQRYRKLFVVGAAKSGTTWLVNSLNGHPEIVIRGEGAFAYQLVPLLQQALAAFNQHQARMDPIARLRDMDLMMISRALVDSQFARYLGESDRDPQQVRVIADKTPQHTIGIPTLNALYPACQVLHIVRDPRDVATSAWFHFGQSDPRDFETYIRYMITEAWPLNAQTAREQGRQLGAGRYQELRYRDLHADEAGRLREVLSFLGVAADDAHVRQCMEAGSFRRHAGGRERGEARSAEFYRSGTTGDWRNHIPVSLAAECCEQIAPLMQAFGFDPECSAQADQYEPVGG